MEEWKMVKDWPSYEVSNTGKVRAVATGRELTQSNGQVRLQWTRTHRTWRKVESLVKEMFGPKEEYIKPTLLSLAHKGETWAKIDDIYMVSTQKRMWNWRTLRFVKGAYGYTARRMSEKVFGYDIPYLPGEEWKRLTFLPGYAVSNLGRVWGDWARCIIKLQPDTGCRYLRLKTNYGRFRVHRLVAIAFLPLPENYETMEVDHINEDKCDNRAENLRWCTKEENLMFYASNHPEAMKHTPIGPSNL